MKMFALFCGFISFSCYAAQITVPAKDVLTAARTIVAQTEPKYSVKGTITCSAINSGWGPATSTCEISIKGATAIVENPNDIIDVVATVKIPTGPGYSFSGTFVAYTETVKAPPYNMVGVAKITLK